MSTNPSPAVAELLQFAENYQHNPNQHIVLDPYQDAVLLLRAKYATYDTITETLRSKGVQVSEATVRNFCRRHHDEMKKLRAEQDRQRRENKAAAADHSSSPAPKRTSTGSESGKPGPKIARDDL